MELSRRNVGGDHARSAPEVRRRGRGRRWHLGSRRRPDVRRAGHLGVETFQEYADGNNVYVSSRTGKQEYTGTIPPDPLILPDAAVLQTRIVEMSKQVPVGAPWTAAKAREWDTISVDQWLRENTVNPDVRSLLVGLHGRRRPRRSACGARGARRTLTGRAPHRKARSRTFTTWPTCLRPRKLPMLHAEA